MQNTPNPKCPRCKCYWKPDETDIKSSGLVCKTCKKCRENGNKYKKENADKVEETKKKYRENNANKILEYNKKYYEDNADKLKEYKKKYRKNNADKVKKYREDNADKIKKYNEDNIEKIKETNKKYREKNKCEHNKEHGRCKICNKYLYLINLQRRHMSRCLKNNNIKKTKPSISYLDCSAKYFVEYFEKKMNLWNETNEVKMNWDNIHIDHIKPVNAFNLDDENEFLDCCHYTNMQPLLVKDNLSKKCKWSDENDLYWCNNIINKEYFDIYIC